MNSRGVQVFAKRDEPTTAGNWEEAQYQSMVQARELELEPPEAKRPTPSFAACAVAGVPRHQQTGGRQQRPQAELAVQQVVRWSVALRWSFVQFRRLQRRRLVRLTDKPPLRLSHGLQKSGSRNPSLPISCRTAVSAAPLCACEIGPTTLETNVTRHGIVVSSQQTSQQRQQSQIMGWRYEGTTTTAWTQPALDRSLILWVGVPSSASRPLLPVSRAVKKYRAAARYSQPRSGNQPIMG